MADKVYCGSGKEKKFQNGGSINTVSIDLDVLNNAFGEYGFTTRAGKRIIKVNVSTKRDGVDQYGNSHSAEVDTWKPDPSYGSGKPNVNDSYQKKANNSLKNQGFNSAEHDEDGLPIF